MINKMIIIIIMMIRIIIMMITLTYHKATTIVMQLTIKKIRVKMEVQEFRIIYQIHK